MKPGSEVPFLDGMDLGTGINTLELMPRGIGVHDANRSPPATRVPGGGGDITIFQLQHPTFIEGFYSALDLSLDFSAAFRLFGGNATFKFAENQKFNSFSQFLIASVTVTKAFKEIPEPQLDPVGRDLLANGDENRFLQEFGDMFVLGDRMGGLYYAVLEFTTTSKEDSEELSQSLDAIDFGGSRRPDKFSQSLSNLKGIFSSRANQLQVFQSGASGQSLETSIDGIINKAQNFASELGDNVVPISAVLRDYASLELPKPPNFTGVQAAAEVLLNYAVLRNEIVQKINDVEYIQLHPEQFIDAAKFDLRGMLQQLTQAMNQLRNNASTCVGSVKDCKFVDVTLPNITLPSRVPGGPKMT